MSSPTKRRTTLPALFLVAGVAAGGSGAWAQPARRPAPPAKIVPPPPPAELVGLVEVGKLVPDRGFIDDPMATDGKRLAVVVTDGASLTEAVVYDDAGVSHERVDLSGVIPTVRRLHLTGSRVFVVADDPAGGAVDAALIDLSGKVVRRHGRATDLTMRTVGGKELVVAYSRSASSGGEQHQIVVFDPSTGKRIPKRGGKVVVGADGRVAKLDLRVDYWLDDRTVLAGRRAGVWRKREDQRSPDTAARYSLLEGKWIKDEAIANLHQHARATEVLADNNGSSLFVVAADGGGALELWRDGSSAGLTLDQPLANYDLATVKVAMRGDRVWLSLAVDPVNPDAVARQRADPEYVDFFEVDAGRATRRARLYAPKKKVTWGWAGEMLWVLEKNVGFSRGGKSLRFFRVG